MDVTCPACSARYRIPGSKVQGRTARMCCKACSTEWLVTADSATPSVSPRAPSVAPRAPSVAPSPLAASPQSTPPAAPARAAVIRRGAERERRDLFATSPVEEVVSSSPQSLRPSPPSYAPSYGARNENSVLFTVDSLKAAARPSTAPRAAETPAWTASSVVPSDASRDAARAADDEGIIDLKALSVMPPPPRNIANVFPSEPPTGFARAVEVARSGGHPALIAHVGGMARRVNPRMAIGAMAGLATLLIASVGLAALFGGDVPHRLTASDAAEGRLAAAAALIGARADDAAAKAALASAEALEPKASAATASSSGAKKARTVGYSPKSHGTAQTTTYVAPRPTKSVDKCGCKGDFNCILRCSAKGK